MEVPQASGCWSEIVQKAAPLPPPKQAQGLSKVVFESCKSSKGIAVAVVDANSIIQGGENLTSSADKLVTVFEVLDEVRDPVSRRRLEILPFSVETMEPSQEALKKVVSFARATGDLQTLSDVDLKLIALTYTLEAQIHGTKHLRDSPPPLRMVSVKRLPEKEMPGWGSNVPNLAEWEALENDVETGSNFNSKILPLKDMNLNVISIGGHVGPGDSSMGTVGEAQVEGKIKKKIPPKKEINIEGKKMVASGVDASQGEGMDDTSNWMPAVSRSTHRRYLRRKGRRESSISSDKLDNPDDPAGDTNFDNIDNFEDCVAEDSKSDFNECSLNKKSDCNVDDNLSEENIVDEVDGVDLCTEELDHLEIASLTDEHESTNTSPIDDNSSEQSWMLRSLSESSVACVTSDFAMQNVILQIGLRLLAPGGMQIRQLNRWVLKCHACNRVTAEIGRIFCPKCGNGGTLRKVSVTVGENGIALTVRRPRVTLRGTKFSLPLPQGGRDAITKNVILREDQLPHKLLYPKSKKKSNKQGEDISSADDIFLQSADKRTPFKPPIRQALAVFSGKRNPNDNHFSRSKH